MTNRTESKHQFPEEDSRCARCAQFDHAATFLTASCNVPRNSRPLIAHYDQRDTLLALLASARYR
jgi:hypothetical protein